MNNYLEKQSITNSSVPFNACLVISGILLVLMLPVLAWLNHHEWSRDQYWNSQIDWFIAFNHYCSSHPELWLNLTQLGNAFILLPLLSFFIIVRPAIWAAFFGAIPLGTLLTHGGKALASIPRPAAVLDENLIHVVGEQLTGHDSLPSGHTATVFVAGTVIMLTLFFSNRHSSRWFILTGLLMTTLTLAASRVAVGAHWPLDLFFGALCGYFGGLSGIFLTQRYSRWWIWIKQTEHQHIPGLILLFWSVSLLPSLYTQPPHPETVSWLAAIIGIATSGYLIIGHYTRAKLSFTQTYVSLQLTYPTLVVSWNENRSQ